MTKSIRVGVLSFHNSTETRALLHAINELGHEPVWIEHGSLNIQSGPDGVEMKPDVDVVLNRLLLSTKQRPIELLGIADAVSNVTPLLNPPDAVLTALNKISTASFLGKNAPTRTPETVVPTSVDEVNDFIVEKHEAVHKSAIGTHGSSTRLVTNSDTVLTRTGESYGLLQERIEHASYAPADVRAYVVGGEVVSVMERKAKADEWRTNIAQGGEGEETGIPGTLTNIITSLVSEMGLDYAGVDLMQHENGRWFILEINPTAGFKGLFSATGVNPAPYMVDMALQRVGEKADRDTIQEVSKSLETTFPKSARQAEPQNGRQVIMNMPFVAVAGTKGTRHVDVEIDEQQGYTAIDYDLAEDIGAGPITEILSMEDGNRYPHVPVDMKIQDTEYQISVALKDLSNRDVNLVLGQTATRNLDIVETKS